MIMKRALLLIHLSQDIRSAQHCSRNIERSAEYENKFMNVAFAPQNFTLNKSYSVSSMYSSFTYINKREQALGKGNHTITL